MNSLYYILYYFMNAHRKMSTYSPIARLIPDQIFEPMIEPPTNYHAKAYFPEPTSTTSSNSPFLKMETPEGIG